MVQHSLNVFSWLFFGLFNNNQQDATSSSSSIGTTAHCRLWPVKQCPSILSYLAPILPIFSLSALEDLFLLPLSIFSWLSPSSSSSSIGTTAHCRLWPVEQCPSIVSYLPPTLPIFSLPALEDLFLLPLSIFSWVFSFFSSLPILEWRSFWASYPPPFSLRDLTSLSFALLSILFYFLLWSSLLALDSSDSSIPHFHILGSYILLNIFLSKLFLFKYYLHFS